MNLVRNTSRLQKCINNAPVLKQNLLKLTTTLVYNRKKKADSGHKAAAG